MPRPINPAPPPARRRPRLQAKLVAILEGDAPLDILVRWKPRKARLLETLSDSLQASLDRCYTGRYLGLCRQLFDAYPTIRKALISESGLALPSGVVEPPNPNPTLGNH